MLDERKATILRAVVEEYIETGQPVGSGHIAGAPGVSVSSATVRNDMAFLEREGFLHQPHTSAGRVPTEKGYRFFVDHLAIPGRLDATDAQHVRSFFARAHGELEQVLHDTSRLLSDLTSNAAVVVGPTAEVATVRSVQLVGLAPTIALLVVVLSNGVVDKHTLELPAEADDVRLSAVAARLATSWVGRSLTEVAAATPKAADGDHGGPDGDGEHDDGLVRLAWAAVSSPAHDEQVFIDGASGMVAGFDAVTTVSEILRILEQQFVVVTLLHDVLDRGLSVAIGTETGMEPLAECAVVVTPYEIDGEPAGSIGVLGPTRMDYSQAIAAVAVVGKRLGRQLSEGT